MSQSQFSLERSRRKALLEEAKKAEQARLERLEQESVKEVLEEVIYQLSRDTSNVFVRAVLTQKLIAAPVLEYTVISLHEMSNVNSTSQQINATIIEQVLEINETKSEQEAPSDLISKINQAKNICESNFLIPCVSHAKYSARISCQNQQSGSQEHTDCIIYSYESSKLACLDICGKILVPLSDSEI